jgi:hypothetical protein
VQKAEVSIEIRKMPIIRRKTSKNMREKPWKTWKSQCWSSLYHMFRIEIHVWGIHFFCTNPFGWNSLVKQWDDSIIYIYINMMLQWVDVYAAYFENTPFPHGHVSCTLLWYWCNACRIVRSFNAFFVPGISSSFIASDAD